ncbi:hypothetical protein L2E82_20093 [Cichorium intybus]|uniref:Uncharacterized protein n=1 Tax=Cichorium intybus TaxID=13427 RepID=A0ACB9DSR0_CICIN|nr:hypothetical protein L2E82_20093 [Cichorium intybus]
MVEIPDCLAAMMGVIAYDLLVLACSYWKLSDYLDNGDRDIESGDGNIKRDKVTMKRGEIGSKREIDYERGEIGSKDGKLTMKEGKLTTTGISFSLDRNIFLALEGKWTTKERKLAVKRDKVTRKGEGFLPNMEFEQDHVQILDALMPLYLNNQILRALQESLASELAARMNAMS